MHLSPADRMTAIILAKTMASNRAVQELKKETAGYIRRLYKYRMFTVGEIAEFAGASEYAVRQAISGEEEFRARSGVHTRHLDHLIRMVDSPQFAKKHIKLLIDDKAKFSAIARVTGISERRLRYWYKEGNN